MSSIDTNGVEDKALENGAINFDEGNDTPSLKQVPVTFKGIKYILVEASAEAVAKWRNAQLTGTRMYQRENEDTRTIALGGMADSEPILVSLCLFKPDENGNLRLDAGGNVDTRFRVAVDVVKGWPNRVTAKLFEKAKEISGLDEIETVEALDKRITDLQKRRERLEKAKAANEEEVLAKN